MSNLSLEAEINIVLKNLKKLDFFGMLEEDSAQPGDLNLENILRNAIETSVLSRRNSLADSEPLMNSGLEDSDFN